MAQLANQIIIREFIHRLGKPNCVTLEAAPDFGKIKLNPFRLSSECKQKAQTAPVQTKFTMTFCECGRYDDGDAPENACYDPRTKAACIKKSSGWGANPNFASPWGIVVVVGFLILVLAGTALIIFFAVYD
jgi:hypothetical protein